MKPHSYTPNFDTGFQHHRAGRLQQAEEIYKKLPHHPDALHMRGMIAHQLQRHEEALELIAKAIRAKPSQAGFYQTFDQVGRALGPEKLIAAYRSLLEQAPGNAIAHNNLGNILGETGLADEAIASYQKAIELVPDFAEAHANLGVAYGRQEKLEEALEEMQRAAALKPDFAPVYQDMGAMLSRLERLDEAADCFRKRLALAPDAEAYFSLGRMLALQERHEEAITNLKAAIALQPDMAKALTEIGIVNLRMGRVEDAMNAYRSALVLEDYPEALNNLGVIRHMVGDPDEAIVHYRKALDLKPEYPMAYSNMLLAMQYSAHYTQEQLFAEHAAFGKRFEPALREEWKLHTNARSPRKRLKIGYVSPDFRKHAVAYFIEPVLAHHDRSRFEIFCYHTHTVVDAVSQRLRQLADHWLLCSQMPDQVLAERIRADGIDILIDLTGHTGGARLMVFARKPAPVQVTYLGYPATTGLTSIDYRLTDVHAEPPGMTEHLNVEKLWRLPEVFCCYRPHDNSPDVIDHPPLQDNGFVTFGCFNNFAKVTDPVLLLWKEILRRVPNSRLMLEIGQFDNPTFRADIEARLQRLGMPMERLILVPRRKENQYVLYNRIDIALDPFPCNGGTTSFDSLWMGVPFITQAGSYFTSRMGVTILTNAGLRELVATNEDEYLDIAVRLATDIPRLTALRSGLRERVQASPLMDAARFTRHMEQAYLGMWEQFCADKTGLPDPLQISNAAYALLGQERLEEAVAMFRDAVAFFPDDAHAHYDLGVALQHQSNTSEAIRCYEEALARKPDMAEAHHNLGQLLANAGDIEQAKQFYRQALALKPDFPEVYNSLGNAFRNQGDYDSALASFMQALSLKMHFVEAHTNLGLLFADQGKLQEAITCYETALALDPNFVVAHNNLAHVYQEQDRMEEAEAGYRKTLALQPDYLPALRNFASLLLALGRPDEAIACCEQAIAFQPDYADAHTNLLLSMQYSASVTPEAVYTAHKRFGEQFGTPLRATWQPHTNFRAPGKRLKIGYVSPDFRRHAVAYFIEPILARHDRTQVEVFCYYNNVYVDTVTQRLQQLADHWVPCKFMSDDELAARIRADGIDILIDLAGHTDGNRLLTFARKPAPVQLTYLGYPATTGLAAVDYRITDVHAEPVGMTEHLNVEQLWRLPDIFCCYRAHDNSPDVIDHPPLQDNGFITFGCFNNFAKVTDPVLLLWKAILQRVPNSRLLLEIAGLDDPVCRTKVEARLSNLGLPLERVLLMPRRKENQYVLYNRIDIALDPFPCNGGTTSFDALWMGVPFVTLAGRHFTSRMGVTILTNAGLQELVANSEEEYLDIAAKLATDIPRLSTLRAGLRQRVQASPLMDAPRFTRQMEQAYRGMWEQWCGDTSALPTPSESYQQGQAFLEQGCFSEAETCFQQTLALAPDEAQAHYALGLALHHQGKLAEAAHRYEQALARNDNLPEAHHNLGLIFTDIGNIEQAKQRYRQALTLKPDFPDAWNSLGSALRSQNEWDGAFECFMKAITFKPDFVEAHYNLGLLFADQDKLDEAMTCYETALLLDPHSAAAHNNMGSALERKGKLQEAAASYRAAFEANPGYTIAWNNFGSLLRNQGRTDEAIGYFNKALEIQPDFVDARTNLLLALQYSASVTPEQMFAAHVRFGEQFEAPLRASWQPHANIRSPGKRLKIGYVSPDFRQHAVAYFIEPILAQHDRAQIEVFCYYNHTQADAVTERLQRLADHWIPCKFLNDDQLAERIRADEIDILIDLAGHTTGNRLLTFARKPAPVQVTYLGYPATTGLTAIDYRITDVHAEPVGMTEALNTETLWRLPDIFCCYRAHDNSPDVIDHPPLQDNGFVTFGCFNNFSKVTDPVLGLWAKILQRVPNARLLLEIAGLDDAVFHADVQARLTKLGLPLERVLLMAREPENQYVLYNRIDIALDPFPCNGGTTSLDALWMGVPFVTLAGRHFTSRMGVTILTNAGLQELVANSEEEYLDIAAKLATDIPRLSVLRNGLRQRVQAGPLMDAPRFTQQMEQAYRGMWEQWCNKEHPLPDPLALNQKGYALLEQGRQEEAVACFRYALSLFPDDGHSHYDLGVALQHRRKFTEALRCYDEALARKPDMIEAHNNIGAIQHILGHPEFAIPHHLKALELKPDFQDAYNNLLLMMQYSASVTPEEMFAEHVAFAERFEAPLRASWQPHTNIRSPGKRLKIGYVSPDFRQHAVAYFIEPILAQHDRAQIEVFCYYNHTQADAVTERLQRLADHWIPCKFLNDDQLAERIRADEIDILIDLAGHTTGNRLLTFARKPAPVQVTYLGYPATTGLTAIDYRITDVHAEPVGMTEALNTETLWRLPDIFCCYRAHDNSPDVIDHPPLQDNGFVTFGCFNNFSKVTDPVLGLWAKILQRVPNARLLLEIAGLDDAVFHADVQARLTKLGLPLERVLLMARHPENQYVLYNRIDIALDPFPCNGGTTSLDALWMGVPFVTLAGRHFTSRMGVTILTNAGLPELTTETEDDYVDTAVRLATDTARLTTMRDGLRQRVQASPLMDAPRFTRQMEQAYRGMWEQWCKPDAATLEETETLPRLAITKQTNDGMSEPVDIDGNSLLAQGRFDEAGSFFQRMIALRPNSAEAHANLGIAYAQQGNLLDAQACFERAITLKPDFAGAHNDLGTVFELLKQPDAASTCYRKALTLNPKSVEAHCNLGKVLKSQGKFEEAVTNFQAAIRLQPDRAEAHYHLGNIFRETRRLDEAIASYLQAISHKPDYAEAFHNLGTAYGEQGKYKEAIEYYKKMLALAPDHALAHCNLGIISHKAGLSDEAIAHERKALALVPNYLDAYQILLLAMQYSARITPEEMFAEHVAFAERFEAPLRASWTAHTNARKPDKRLKIGYVSPDFRKHAVAYFIEPILAQHDRAQVEVFCYYSHAQVDAVTERLQRLADHWIPCKHLSEDRLAERIRADEIDILIDLAGHTGGNRLLAFARKPAPVQLTYLGYPATTGLTAIDYRITDVHAEPVGMTEHLNVEQLWRLPDLFCCYRAHDNSPDVIDHPPLQDNGFVTFGCFNNFSKVSDPVLKLWAKILQRVPNAKLMLEIAGLDVPAFHAEVEARLASFGLPAERLLLVPRRPENQYVLYNQIDIALDPFPCNGGTTSLDALWMGVPFVALAGRHFTSRMGVTILTNAGLQELITETEDDYVEIAVKLATDLQRLTTMRDGLRQRVQASPLMDGPRFTQQLEKSYRSMWKTWCNTTQYPGSNT
jgi:predicted O-linked N-acetylglucosamine transferase (SPINDLY family)